MKSKARLLILNGTSSAGKSSLIKEFVRLAPQLYLKHGIDQTLNFLPDHYFKQPLWNTVMGKSNEAGPLGDAMMCAMNSSNRVLLEKGFSVIADHVIISDLWLDHAKTEFKNFDAYLIGIHCRKDIIAQRELERKNRTLGSAILQYDVVHKNRNYDLIIDTSDITPTEGAESILQFLASSPRPQVLINSN
jgi:chloramphenicol 3-O phosphotransferase